MSCSGHTVGFTYMEKEIELRTIVIKVGGSTIGAHDTLPRDCASLQAQGHRLVIVHGGGSTVSEWLARLQIGTEFAEGLRTTPKESLEVVIAVLGGLVNKILVQQFLTAGAQAVGLSGVDGGIVISEMNQRGLGFVGEKPLCNPDPLLPLLDAGIIPIVAPIGLTPDNHTLININADTVAGAVAVALGASEILFMTDVPGVQDEQGEIIEDLDADTAIALQKSGILKNGMLPKVAACQTAAASGVQSRIIDGRVSGAILMALNGTNGTVVT